jgi:hypothetical protein
MIKVNTRVLSSPTTGVQRYLQELVNRMPPDKIQTISPKIPLAGLQGHLWEQTILPVLGNTKFLWSPSNTGPLAVKNYFTSHPAGQITRYSKRDFMTS